MEGKDGMLIVRDVLGDAFYVYGKIALLYIAAYARCLFGCRRLYLL